MRMEMAMIVLRILSLSIFFAAGTGLSSSTGTSRSCLLFRSICNRDVECRQQLRNAQHHCGNSLEYCDAKRPAVCMRHVRWITKHYKQYSNCLCLEKLGSIRLCETFRQLIFHNPCAGRFADVNEERRQLKLPVANKTISKTASVQRKTTTDRPVPIVPKQLTTPPRRRTTRSPMGEKIRQWKHELSGDLRDAPADPENTGSCYYALHQVCLKHIACKYLWTTYRNSCYTGADNECKMKDREDCWQSFEGISWTGLGNCTCMKSDHNSDCHWIRLQTRYNKCIYEISQTMNLATTAPIFDGHMKWTNSDSLPSSTDLTEDAPAPQQPAPSAELDYFDNPVLHSAEEAEDEMVPGELQTTTEKLVTALPEPPTTLRPLIPVFTWTAGQATATEVVRQTMLSQWRTANPVRTTTTTTSTSTTTTTPSITPSPTTEMITSTKRPSLKLYRRSTTPRPETTATTITEPTSTSTPTTSTTTSTTSTTTTPTTQPTTMTSTSSTTTTTSPPTTTSTTSTTSTTTTTTMTTRRPAATFRPTYQRPSDPYQQPLEVRPGPVEQPHDRSRQASSVVDQRYSNPYHPNDHQHQPLNVRPGSMEPDRAWQPAQSVNWTRSYYEANDPRYQGNQRRPTEQYRQSVEATRPPYNAPSERFRPGPVEAVATTVIPNWTRSPPVTPRAAEPAPVWTTGKPPLNPGYASSNTNRASPRESFSALVTAPPSHYQQTHPPPYEAGGFRHQSLGAIPRDRLDAFVRDGTIIRTPEMFEQRLSSPGK